MLHDVSACYVAVCSVRRTLILCAAGNLAEQLDKIGQVVAEELGLENEVLARVVGIEGSSQELGFADDAQRGPPLGALQCNWPSAKLSHSDIQAMAHPECEVGKALGQAGQRLEARAGLCNERERRRRARKVSAGVLDALGLAGLVLEGARGGRCEPPALLALAEGLLAGSSLGAPAGGRAGEHCVEGAGLGAGDGVGGGNGMESSSCYGVR